MYEPQNFEIDHKRDSQHRSRGTREDREKIAVVGTGISGLSAAWLLSQDHDVTVYEKNNYVGGHSHTADINVDGKNISVDTGFIVYNPLNYPNLVALFEHLDVPTKRSEMSFSASLENGALEYSGTDLRGLFCQRKNILRPRFLRMVTDLLRFYKQAPSLCNDRSLQDVSLGSFLRRERYSDAFICDHLMPMGAAIWSSSINEMLSFPTLAFLKFFQNHGLLQLTGRPEWRTVDGGSREYVRRLTADFSDRIQYGDPVTTVVRRNGQVIVATASGSRKIFDHVVMACHSDEALKLLTKPTHAERNALGNIHYQHNRAILHTDTSLMPTRRTAWASWNYIDTGAGDTGRSACITYWMNRLQGLQTSEPVLVTLNPNRNIDPKKVLRTYDYEHPVFDLAAMRAQPRLWDLQGQQNTWFCGAYFGSGFHEDGIQAGLAVAEMLGRRQRPWNLEEPSSRIGLPKNSIRPADSEAAAA